MPEETATEETAVDTAEKPEDESSTESDDGVTPSEEETPEEEEAKKPDDEEGAKPSSEESADYQRGRADAEAKRADAAEGRLSGAESEEEEADDFDTQMATIDEQIAVKRSELQALSLDGLSDEEERLEVTQNREAVRDEIEELRDAKDKVRDAKALRAADIAAFDTLLVKATRDQKLGPSRINELRKRVEDTMERRFKGKPLPDGQTFELLVESEAKGMALETKPGKTGKRKPKPNAGERSGVPSAVRAAIKPGSGKDFMSQWHKLEREGKVPGRKVYEETL